MFLSRCCFTSIYSSCRLLSTAPAKPHCIFKVWWTLLILHEVFTWPLKSFHYVHLCLFYSGQSDDQPWCLAPRRRPHSASSRWCFSQHGRPFPLQGAGLQLCLNSCGCPSWQARCGRCELRLSSSDHDPAEHSQGLLLVPIVSPLAFPRQP